MAMSRKAMFTAAGAAGALALGLVVPTVALAEGAAPSASPSASPSTSADPGARADREQRRTERRAALAEALAKELGISQERVAAALEKVETAMADEARAQRQERLKEQLDQAVQDGKLTREQADAILEAAEAGVLPGGHGHGGPGGFGGFGGRGPR